MTTSPDFYPVPKPNKRKKTQKGTYAKRVPKYREKEVFNRDEGKCVFCKNELGKITECCHEGKGAHHIIKRHKAHPQHKHDLANLISLCQRHHDMAHGKKYGDQTEFEKNISDWCKLWQIAVYGLDKHEQIRKMGKG